MDHETIDLSTPNGGDLLVINKLSTKIDNDSLYEVAICLKQIQSNRETLVKRLLQCCYIFQQYGNCRKE